MSARAHRSNVTRQDERTRKKLRPMRRMVQKETKFNLRFWLLTEAQTLAHWTQRIGGERVWIWFYSILWWLLFAAAVFQSFYLFIYLEGHLSRFNYDRCTAMRIYWYSGKIPFVASKQNRSWAKCSIFYGYLTETKYRQRLILMRADTRNSDSRREMKTEKKKKQHKLT